MDLEKRMQKIQNRFVAVLMFQKVWRILQMLINRVRVGEDLEGWCSEV